MNYFYGHIYKGEWKDDVRNGRGRFEFPNGDYFQGSYTKGRREGPGKEFCKDDTIRFEGEFKDD